MRVYISGPMRDIEDFNYSAFRNAAHRFRAAGFDVFNPADSFGKDCNLPPEVYLRFDVFNLARCDAIAMLPGWHTSRGAKLELCIAQHLEMTILDAMSMKSYTNIATLSITSLPL